MAAGAAVRSADLRDYQGAPDDMVEALSAQSVGRIEEYQRDGERVFAARNANGLKR